MKAAILAVLHMGTVREKHRDASLKGQVQACLVHNLSIWEGFPFSTEMPEVRAYCFASVQEVCPQARLRNRIINIRKKDKK